MPTDHYVRVYYRIVDDPKFADIYDDKPALGWWLTLLLAADATYPVPANLPRRLPDKVLAKLIRAALVDRIGVDRFTIRGLSAEREQRSSIARKGALALHEQRSRSAISEPSRAEQIKSEPSIRRGGLEPISSVLGRIEERGNR